MKKPVVFIIFNRPDTTAIVFEEIRRYQPKQLFIIADGPRIHKETEALLCEKAKTVVQVDWECEVIRIYSDINLGCQKRISSGLDIVFEQVEDAIILEDDCVPHKDFFRFCEEMLDYHKDNEQVMAISGDNFQVEDTSINESYYATKYFICWGWATWKTRWNKFEIDISKWCKERDSNLLADNFSDPFERDYWREIMELTNNKQVDSWFYPWQFSIWGNRGITIAPQVNLVSNIGFGVNSTHTKMTGSVGDNVETRAMEFPLTHPVKLSRNLAAEQFIVNEFLGLIQIKDRAIINNSKNLFYEKILVDNKSVFTNMGKISIFGTGKLGRIINKSIPSGQVICYINSQGIESLIDGIPVYSTNNIPYNKIDTIMVSIEGTHDIEIISNLRKLYPTISILSWKDLLFRGIDIQ